LEFAPSKLITAPERYLMSCSTMDFTKLPISSGFPSLFIGRVLANASTSSISSLVLSVLIGPGYVDAADLFACKLFAENFKHAREGGAVCT